MGDEGTFGFREGRPLIRLTQPTDRMLAAWKTFAEITADEAVRGLLLSRPDLDPWTIYKERRSGLLVRLIGFSRSLPLTLHVEADSGLNEVVGAMLKGPRDISGVRPDDLTVYRGP